MNSSSEFGPCAASRDPSLNMSSAESGEPGPSGGPFVDGGTETELDIWRRQKLCALTIEYPQVPSGVLLELVDRLFVEQRGLLLEMTTAYCRFRYSELKAQFDSSITRAVECWISLEALKGTAVDAEAVRSVASRLTRVPKPAAGSRQALRTSGEFLRPRF